MLSKILSADDVANLSAQIAAKSKLYSQLTIIDGSINILFDRH
ncbi:MAG: hypothetical protein WC900_07315 [Oscillospiraceae bacterium]